MSRRKKLKRRRKVLRNRIILLSTIAILVICCVLHFRKTHFCWGTTIANVDCTWNSVAKAEKKLNKALENTSVKFIFDDNGDDERIYFSEWFDLQFTDLSGQLQSILNQQRSGDKNREFHLENYTFDEVKLRDTLSGIPNLQSKNQKKARNAYLVISDDLLKIVPEVNGTEIDFEDAFDLASNSLKKGDFIIDFTEIIKPPKVLSNDPNLVAQKEQANKILSSEIIFTLADKSIITLDKSITKNWLKKVGNSYKVDIDSYLPDFVDELAVKAKEASACVPFTTIDSGTVNLPIGSKYQVTLAKEKELVQLKSELESGARITRDPLYTAPTLSFDDVKTYVEIDLSKQRVRMFIDGKAIVDTPCVTGCVASGNATPRGIFFLTYKTTDAILRGEDYNSPVKYWMPFNGNIGMHDASWRKTFGKDIYVYNGSHGCINLPYNEAKKIYENITKEMPIIVYESDISKS